MIPNLKKKLRTEYIESGGQNVNILYEFNNTRCGIFKANLKQDGFTQKIHFSF